MNIDRNALENLLHKAQLQADQAARENAPQLYREAFETSLQAIRLLAEEAGAWRSMVARATEEFQQHEGV